MTFKIMTDSTADLPEQWVKDHDITVLGLTLQLDGVTYETVGDQKMTGQALLKKMEAGGMPTTSQVNVGQFEMAFRQAVAAGQDVLYIAFSSGLSGTYQSATIARDMVLDEHLQARIEVFDSKSATMGEGYLVMKAVEAREAGEDLSSTLEKIAELAPRIQTYLMVDDLQHLVRGGRLSKVAAMVGGLINIKPMISIDAEGRLYAAGKIRGRKKAMKEMVKLTMENLDDSTVIVAYTKDDEGAEELKNILLAQEGIETVLVNHIGPVVSSHIGSGSLAIQSIGKTKR